MPLINNLVGLKNRRRALRRAMSSAEVYLWVHLKGRQLAGLKFRRQHSIRHYIVDFYCPELNLAIEVDGEHHFRTDQQEYDRQRQVDLEALGIRLLRFTTDEVKHNVDGVLSAIETFARTINMEGGGRA